MLVIGATCSVVALGLLVVVQDIGWFRLASPRLLIQDWHGYAVDAPLRTIVTGLFGLVTACGIGMAAAWGLNRHSPANFHIAKSVFFTALGPQDKGKLPWVTVTVENGDCWEGYVRGVPMSGSDRPDLSLRSPIFLTRGGQRFRAGIEALVLPGDQIHSVMVRYDPPSVAE